MYCIPWALIVCICKMFVMTEKFILVFFVASTQPQSMQNKFHMKVNGQMIAKSFAGTSSCMYSVSQWNCRRGTVGENISPNLNFFPPLTQLSPRYQTKIESMLIKPSAGPRIIWCLHWQVLLKFNLRQTMQKPMNTLCFGASGSWGEWRLFPFPNTVYKIMHSTVSMVCTHTQCTYHKCFCYLTIHNYEHCTIANMFFSVRILLPWLFWAIAATCQET